MAKQNDHEDSNVEPSVYEMHVRKTMQIILAERDGGTRPVNSFSDAITPEEAAVVMTSQQEGLSCVQAARKVLAFRDATRVRAFAERTINDLFGCPGADYETPNGIEILTETLQGWGLRAFTDDFLAVLAQAHRDADWREAHRKRA